jgi:hypothetical protein
MKDSDINKELTNAYILNREYFSECFDESVDKAANPKPYSKAIILLIMAGVLFVTKAEAYAAWFLLCLGGLELLSIRYKRSWWITRQMLSRVAGKTVNIRIDDQGIFTESPQQQQALLWKDITEIKCTEKGFVVVHSSGNNYLSKSGLDEGALALLVIKAQAPKIHGPEKDLK